MAIQPGDTNAFIVRIWVEERDRHGKPVSWRGTIQHVQSRKKRYFKDLASAFQFIQDCTGWKPSKRVSRRRRKDE